MRIPKISEGCPGTTNNWPWKTEQFIRKKLELPFPLKSSTSWAYWWLPCTISSKLDHVMLFSIPWKTYYSPWLFETVEFINFFTTLSVTLFWTDLCEIFLNKGSEREKKARTPSQSSSTCANISPPRVFKTKDINQYSRIRDQKSPTQENTSFIISYNSRERGYSIVPNISQKLLRTAVLACIQKANVDDECNLIRVIHL